MNALVPAPTKEQRIAQAIADLTDKERSALKYHNASVQRRESFDIPEDKWQPLYELYQQGKTCEEIRRLNHPSFSLGQIVAARVMYDWTGLLDEYIRDLEPAVIAHANQVQLESINVISDMIAVCHKLFSEQIKRYLQTGNKADLKDTPFERLTLKQYNDLLGTLMRATGQDQDKTVTVSGKVVHEAKSIGMSPEKAANLLDEFVKDDKK